MSLIKDYFQKTKKHIEDYGELTIVLIQVGAFFEVYGLKDKNDNINGSNIMDFSRICDLNVVDKKACCDLDAVVMAGFKDHLLDKYIKKLMERESFDKVIPRDYDTVLEDFLERKNSHLLKLGDKS